MSSLLDRVVDAHGGMGHITGKRMPLVLLMHRDDYEQIVSVIILDTNSSMATLPTTQSS
ncbi:MAG TPA: hypothetical protein VEL11_00475 [Candidatus Bathyarchaeia archaeon]|nr:hypothetical protein [Candidatus Bathyarchaeia archaeon]